MPGQGEAHVAANRGTDAGDGRGGQEYSGCELRLVCHGSKTGCGGCATRPLSPVQRSSQSSDLDSASSPSPSATPVNDRGQNWISVRPTVGTRGAVGFSTSRPVGGHPGSCPQEVDHVRRLVLSIMCSTLVRHSFPRCRRSLSNCSRIGVQQSCEADLAIRVPSRSHQRDIVSSLMWHFSQSRSKCP